MKQPILIAADHAGFALKHAIREKLLSLNYDVTDLRPTFVEGDDYPPIARKLALAVVRRNVPGVLICGSGVGMAIAANRIKRARAVLGHSVAEVERARMDDDVNILTLSGWQHSVPKAIRMIHALVETKTSNEKRHRRRVAQLG